MATLLEMTDLLIGDVLAGNIYTDTNTFADTVKSRPLPSTPIEGKINASTETAHRGGNQYDDKAIQFVNRGGPYAIASYGLLRTFDVAAISHWIRNVGRQVYFLPSNNNDPITRDRSGGVTTETIVKSATWIASQFLLASLNKGDVAAHGLSNMIWNPLSFPVAALPGTRGLSVFGISPTGITGHATGLFGTYKDNVRAAALIGEDRLSAIRKGTYSEVAPVHRLSQLRSPIAPPGFMGDLTKVGESDTLQQEKLPGDNSLSVSSQVDGGGATEAAILAGLHTNIYTSERPYNLSNAIRPLEKLEDQARKDDSKNPAIDKLKNMFTALRFPNSNAKDVLSAYAYMVNPRFEKDGALGDTSVHGTDGLIDVDAAFIDENQDTSLVEKNPIDNVYMPFMFQDLRDGTTANEKFLYFRAFLKGEIAETFTPDWQTERYYGRVDEIPTYLGTSRIINVSFDVVAWRHADLLVIYRKLQKLQSMVYPSYTLGGFMNSGPIIRMRIGDLIAGENNRGLPGYITSLDFSYDDGIWNIERDLKVPRKITVSLSYTVLHDGNPGVYPLQQWSLDTSTGGNNQVIEGTEVCDGLTFGRLKITKDKVSTNFKVSAADVRKIFQSAKNKKSK